MRISTVFFVAQILLILTGCSQINKIEKGYAYARTIISGVKPKVNVAENGSIAQKSNEPGMQYFIDVETRDTSFFSVKNIWINTRNYYAEAEAVNDFPVVLPKNPGSSENYDTLVHENKYKTWKINVGQIIPASDTGFAKPDQLKKSEVLIGFLYKGSMHYYSISKIKYLESLRLQ